MWNYRRVQLRVVCKLKLCLWQKRTRGQGQRSDYTEQRYEPPSCMATKHGWHTKGTSKSRTEDHSWPKVILCSDLLFGHCNRGASKERYKDLLETSQTTLHYSHMDFLAAGRTSCRVKPFTRQWQLLSLHVLPASRKREAEERKKKNPDSTLDPTLTCRHCSLSGIEFSVGVHQFS